MRLCGCAYRGGCAQRCGLARAVPASLLSQHQNICPWHRAPALGVSPALCSRWGKKIHAAATGSSGERTDLSHSWKEKGRLLFFQGTSNAAAFLVVLGIFLRWQFSDILGFHKFLIFSVSPWLQGKKETCPLLCLPHLQLLIISSLQPIK